MVGGSKERKGMEGAIFEWTTMIMVPNLHMT
jgi:hypothetical protein